MGELTECCLDGCTADLLPALLTALIERASALLEVDAHGSAFRLDDHDPSRLVQSGGSCSVHLAQFRLDASTSIERVVVQIFPVARKFDLFVVFREEDASDFALCIDRLNAVTSDMRTRFGLTDVYCGMDPASDAETRFFTNGALGPLSAK
ncbi:MAG: hypothetical protein R3B13_14855 [Polyangiaceae bacterium]